MLTTLHVEGFKAIGGRQRIELAPLTVLVGRDGAGKSTILHALLYLHELLAHGRADAERVELDGTVVELGGFARLVHGHDPSRAIVLRAEVTTPGTLQRFGQAGSDFPFPDLDDGIDSAWIELRVRMRTTTAFHGPLVDRLVIGAGSCPEPLVWLETGSSLHDDEPLYARVNLGHPLLAAADREMRDAWASIAVPESVLHGEDLTFESPRHGGDPQSGEPGRLLPTFAITRARLSALPPHDQPLHVISGGNDREERRVLAQVCTFLEMAVLGTTSQLAASLRSVVHIGSLRAIPERDILGEHAARSPSWSDGLAAWDRLLTDRSTLVERTNRWLEKLGTGCRVLVQPLLTCVSLPADRPRDAAIRRLRLDTGTGSLVLPSEVGAGVSQLLPVVVAALETRSGITLVEQPEVHVHPAVQVGLGDLFIAAATREGGCRTMLVETHSEHLILRLLRRIRQTNEDELPVEAPSFSATQLSVLHVEAHSDGLRIRRLRVDERGDFCDPWPNGFFGERTAELL